MGGSQIRESGGSVGFCLREGKFFSDFHLNFKFMVDSKCEIWNVGGVLDPRAWR